MAESKIENIEILAAIGFGFTMLFYAFDAVNTFNTDPLNKIKKNDYDVWLIADPTLNSLELWLSGVVLFITGIFEALNEKIMDANICVIYSSFWITTWYFSVDNGNGNNINSYGGDRPTMDELGLYHLLFLIIAAVFAIAKLKSKKIELACHGAFAVFLLFMVIFYFTKEKILLRIAGIFGFIDAAVWWYLGFGSLINEGMGDIVPMF
jgi:succinate-acetate transporter protein